MNTKPTPSPELPDLDREILRTHARRVFEQRHDVDDEAMDELIAYVRSANARRAQPEGEDQYTVDYRELAGKILSFAGISSRGSLEPGADPLADRLAEKLAGWGVKLGQPEGEAPQAEKLERQPIGYITTGDVEHGPDGPEIGGWDIDFDHKVIDAMPEFAVPEKTYAVYLEAAPAAQQAESDAQAGDEAVELLAAVFDAWENGIDCYEYPESNAGYLGMAFKLDGDVFQRCVDLLNRENPPRNAALAAQSQGAQPNEFEVAIHDCALILDLPKGAGAMEVCRAVNRLATAAQQAAAPGALYSYMGESGQYELLGNAVGAGKCRLVEPLTVYRDTANGKLYFRDPADFAARMVSIQGITPSAPGTPEAPSRDDVLEEAAGACESEFCSCCWSDDEVAAGAHMAAVIRGMKSGAAKLDGGQGEGGKA